MTFLFGCRVRFITALFVVVTLVGATITASGSSHLVGAGAVEHCGNSNGLSVSCRDDEGIQLRFDMSLESFVNLAMTSPIQGTAFGERFVATDRQMLTLRLAVGRWAAYAPSEK